MGERCRGRTVSSSHSKLKLVCTWVCSVANVFCLLTWLSYFWVLRNFPGVEGAGIVICIKQDFGSNRYNLFLQTNISPVQYNRRSKCYWACSKGGKEKASLAITGLALSCTRWALLRAVALWKLTLSYSFICSTLWAKKFLSKTELGKTIKSSSNFY